MFLANFALTFHHKYPLKDIEGMLPWERDIYVKLITEYVHQENERLKEQARSRER